MGAELGEIAALPVKVCPPNEEVEFGDGWVAVYRPEFEAIYAWHPEVLEKAMNKPTGLGLLPRYDYSLGVFLPWGMPGWLSLG